MDSGSCHLVIIGRYDLVHQPSIHPSGGIHRDARVQMLKKYGAPFPARKTTVARVPRKGAVGRLIRKG